MKFEGLTKAIDKKLNEYRVTIDGFVTNFKARTAMVEKTLYEAEGKWTPEYANQYKAEHMPKAAEYSGRIGKEQEEARSYINRCLESIKAEIDGYFNAPIDPDFAAKITAIASVGMQPTDTEFGILRDAASSYFELRLLQTIADRREGKERLVPALGEGLDLTYNRITPKDPYDIGTIPSPDTVNKALYTYESAIASVLDYYCGENAELSDGLPSINGGKADGVTAISAASAYWTSKHREAFEMVLNEANSILPEAKRTKALNESERNIVDAIINPEDAKKYSTLLPNNVRVAAAKDPAIRGWLERDPRYSKYLEEV